MPDDERSAISIAPNKWFGVLCQSGGADQRGRLTLTNIVSQFRHQQPPAESGVAPHAHVQSTLVLGAIGGIGTFNGDILLENPDGREFWRAPQIWAMQLDGAVNSAIYVQPIDLWLREPGTYRFKVRLREAPEIEWTVPFEVAEAIGPGLTIRDLDPPA